MWREVADARTRLKARPSRTGSLGDAYRDRVADLERVLRGAGEPGGANGVVAFAGRRPLALDLFDRMDGPEADRDAVPRVYHSDQERKLYLLLIREMSVEPGIILVGRVAVGDAGQRL